MAIIVMAIGQSGTGKSTSLRNFKAGEVAIMNINGKPLPFKNTDLKVFNPKRGLDANGQPYPNEYTQIMQVIPAAISKGIKAIVIDDVTYLMTKEFMRTSNQKGYDKFNLMATNFNSLLEYLQMLPDDVVVYLLGHTEYADDGREHFKTVGKMIDNYINVEGCVTIVLKTVVQDGNYFFSTRNSGQDTVKTPLGMFAEPLIDNDLKAVDGAIRKYYGIAKAPAKEGKK